MYVIEILLINPGRLLYMFIFLAPQPPPPPLKNFSGCCTVWIASIDHQVRSLMLKLFIIFDELKTIYYNTMINSHLFNI